MNMEQSTQHSANRTSPQKIKKWVWEHKIATAIIAILLLAVIGVIFQFLPNSSFDQANTRSMEMQAPRGSFSKTDSATTQGSASNRQHQQQSEIEVTEGDIEIESEQAEKDEEKIRSITENYGGYIEKSRQNETDTRLTMSITSKVPSSKFDDFFLKIRDSFEVESYNVENYRINIERAVDEKEIFTKTMNEYSNIRKEIRGMRANEEKINLLMKLTDKELELAQKEEKFSREIAQAKKRGKFATASITLEERLSPSLIPENIGSNFMKDLSEALEGAVDHLTSIVTFGIVLFFGVIKFIVYALIVIIPLWFIWYLYKRYLRK